METLLMRVQSKMVDFHRELSARFMSHVQLKEQFDDNEIHLHYLRGYLQAWADAEKMIMEGMQANKNASTVAVPFDLPKEEVRSRDRPDTSPGGRLATNFEGQAMDPGALQ